ncbi:MAG TPA: AraC family transcriptional regulator [Polyangiaceae bacterium]|nr:AraC family transcriptional regulator [Polyangiaceae bacterium]
MTLKCGEAITPDGWKGWPLRVARFAASGKTQGLVSPHDSVLVWGGGTSEVTIQQQAQSQRFRRRAGTIDLIPKGTLLEQVSWQGQPCTCVAVTFESGNVERALGAPAVLEPEQLRVALPDTHVVELVHQLRTQATAGQPWGSLYVEALSLTLASYVYARYGTRTPVAQEASPSSREWQRLVAFVEDHLEQELTLQDLASLVGYSPDHFARLFKLAFEITPYQYVLERRVARAKLLLRARAHSIAEIAVACGFSSQAHLCVTFKTRVGVTPGAYRRS